MTSDTNDFYIINKIEELLWDIMSEINPELVQDMLGYVFEISWEVVNKVGGIYTVIRSKSGVTVEELGDNYFLIGPYNREQCQTEVEILEPEDKVVQDVISSMRNEGLHVVYGKWLIEGNPKVILFDIESSRNFLDSWRKDLWDRCHIGIPHHDTECLNLLLFGGLVAWFMGTFNSKLNNDRAMMAHFHEWMSGIGLLFIRCRHHDVCTIFTTHATLLGRYLCAGNVDFYNNLENIDVEKEASDRQIYHRYCIERGSATLAHVFTTVSQITADEAEHLLKRKPDVVTPNGLNIIKYTALHEFQNLHAKSKEKIHEFVRGHFYGNLDFDLDKTLYFFIAGRYEYRNKGADLFLDAMSRLNQLLKSANSDATVIAFMIFPAKTNNFNVESLRGQAYLKQLRLTLSEIHDNMGKKLFDVAMSGKLPDGPELLEANDLTSLKRCLLATHNSRNAPIVTHNMLEDREDPILNNIRRLRMFNQKTDRVKIIFYPEFLSKVNPLFSIDYEEFVRGCHLGVFPSYYEPWGYTPAECTVMGVPNISTNLSGFGRFMDEHIDYPEFYGIYVIDRRFKSVKEITEQMSDQMYSFSKMSRRQRIILRNRTERLSDLLDWKNLGIYYQQARILALKRVHPERAAFLRIKETDINLHYPRPPSAGATPSLSRQVSEYEEDEDTESRCAPDADDLLVFRGRILSEENLSEGSVHETKV